LRQISADLKRIDRANGAGLGCAQAIEIEALFAERERRSCRVGWPVFDAKETEAMKKYLQLLVLAALGYAFWVYGLPWVQRQVGQSRPPVSNPARGVGGACVQMAARASEELHDNVLETGRALMDDAAWENVTSELEWSMNQARQACACKLESCALTRQALSTLDSVFSSARGALLRSSQSIPLELSRPYEQANQQLWDAYDLAKEGK
jgi:hypothetical protein